MVTPGAQPLLEREAELTALEAVIADLATGQGRLATIEGPGGIGKSRLLAAARDRASDAGLRVLTGRAAELERSFSFGIVRQLLEPVVLTATPEQRDRWLAGAARLAGAVLDVPDAKATASGDQDLFPKLHGLYWLCANLASEGAILVTVDDLQWADEASLAFLGFLARRLEGLPVVLAVASRPVEPVTQPLVAQILADPAATPLRPHELSVPATTELVRDRIGDVAEDEFCHACHHATQGNPFLLSELLREIAAQGIAPTAANAARPLALEPDAVSRVVLLRLGRLPEHAARLAHAVAVLGDGTDPRDAAELASLGPDQLGEARIALARAEILDGREETLHLVHPIVRNTLYEDLAPHERERQHEQAARIRQDRGCPPEELGAHLLQTRPRREPWVVAGLRQAATRALALGDPRLACRLLERALDEGVAEGRAEIVAELAHAEARAGHPAAVERFREAIELAEDARARVLAARELAGFLMYRGHPREAVAVLGDVRRTLSPEHRELDEVLQSGLIGAAYLSLSARRDVEDVFAEMHDHGGPPRSFFEAVHISGLALDAAMSDGRAARAVELARRALEADLPTDPTTGGNAFLVAVVALTFSERLGEAHRLYTSALDDARARGHVDAVATLSALRAMVAFRRGSVLDAEADANVALETEQPFGLRDVALAYALLAAIEREATPAQLDQLGADPRVVENPEAPPYTQLLYARGAVALHRGEHARALSIFRSFDRPDVGWGASNPSVAPWRSGAASALAALGREEDAKRLTAHEVELARGIGLPRSLGMALRVQGTLEGGDAGVRLLRDAVETLRASEGRLELARALAELGAMLRRAGRRSEARDPLREGYALAVECGSDRLAALARAELAATGARPRRSALAGTASLTPSERRVASLAASGAMNRDIAQTLFVTEKTVETHLGHAYAKLGVRSRRELSGALAI